MCETIKNKNTCLSGTLVFPLRMHTAVSRVRLNSMMMMMMLISLPTTHPAFRSCFSLPLALPHLLAPLCNLCLRHLWRQSGRWHLCQSWQPKPRRLAKLSLTDSFRQLHSDSDLYERQLTHPRPLCGVWARWFAQVSVDGIGDEFSCCLFFWANILFH